MDDSGILSIKKVVDLQRFFGTWLKKSAVTPAPHYLQKNQRVDGKLMERRGIKL